MRHVSKLCAGFAVVATIMLISSGVSLTHFREQQGHYQELEQLLYSAELPPEQPVAAADGAARGHEHAERVATMTAEATQHSPVLQVQRAEASAHSATTPAVKAPVVAGCLITKWTSIWLAHKDGTRSHVAHPTADCEARALEILDETLDRYPKAHGGEGLYSLDQAHSAAACLLSACPAPAGYPTLAPLPVLPVGLSEQAAMDQLLRKPPNGWGMGASPDWIGRASLRFNGAAKRAFGALRLEVGQPLLLVFGGASVNDMLRNWAIHVQKLQLPYAVACMDSSLFDLADAHGLPGVMMVEHDAGDVEKEVTTRWKYFRMDPAAFMTMGILKVRFFIEFMAAGFDVLCADLDVVWLRDPRPWVAGTAEQSAMLLNYPDVIVSTDVTHGGADTDDRAWGMKEEMNTGMLLLRSSPGAMATCMAWVDRMRQEMVSIRKLPKNSARNLHPRPPRFPLSATLPHSHTARRLACARAPRSAPVVVERPDLFQRGPPTRRGARGSEEQAQAGA